MSNNNSKYKYDPRRRTILKGLAVGGAATLAGGVGAVITSCSAKKEPESSAAAVGGGEMTYRVNPSTGDRVSILGYGCMRWPSLPDSDGEIGRAHV